MNLNKIVLGTSAIGGVWGTVDPQESVRNISQFTGIGYKNKLAAKGLAGQRYDKMYYRKLSYLI